MNPFEQGPYDSSEQYRSQSQQQQRQSPPQEHSSASSSSSHPQQQQQQQQQQPRNGLPMPPRYNDLQGGSFNQYAQQADQRPSSSSAAMPRAGGVSFQVPPQRPQTHRATTSRESVKKDLFGNSSNNAAASTSDLPELSRGNSRDPENGGFSNSDFKRKKSLVRPDRERMDPNHRQCEYWPTRTCRIH